LRSRPLDGPEEKKSVSRSGVRTGKVRRDWLRQLEGKDSGEIADPSAKEKGEESCSKQKQKKGLKEERRQLTKKKGGRRTKTNGAISC